MHLLEKAPTKAWRAALQTGRVRCAAAPPALVTRRLFEKTATSVSECVCRMPESGGGAWRRWHLVWRHEQSMVQPRRQSLGHAAQAAQVVASKQGAPHAGRSAVHQAKASARPALDRGGAATRAGSRARIILAVCVCGVRARADAAAPCHKARLTNTMVNTRSACCVENTWKPPTPATRWANR